MKQKLLLFLLLLTSLATYAYDFESNGIYYNITSEDDKTVAVKSGDTKYSGDVVIPETVTYSDTEYTVTAIGEAAFFNCSSLASIELPASLTSIGSYAFKGCSSLTSIELPASLTTIGEQAFFGCSSLTSIELPASLTTIGESAFQSCTSLTSIELPSSLTEIGNYAFDGCLSMTNIKLSASLKSIKYAAFAYCESLTSIELPASLTSISDCAFEWCISMKTITSFNVNPPALGSGVFQSCPVETVYVPDEAVDAYKVADGWKEFNIVGIDTSGVEDAIFGGDAVESATVYTLQGVRVKGVSTMDDVKSLTPGLYIVNGRKVFVK